MGKIDSETKEYVKRPEVFVDLFNHLIYDGKEVIDPNRLQELDTASTFIPFDENGKAFPVQRYRDVLKSAVIMKDDNVAYNLILGVENQTTIHYAMPVRNMGYDAFNYASQVKSISKHSKFKNANMEFLKRLKKDDKIIPVITLVVYFGQKPWDGPMSIYEMFTTNEKEILKFVPNYKMNLISPVSMEREEIDKFKSNFKELAAFIRCGKDKKAMQELVKQEAYKHLDPVVANIANDVTNAGLKIEVNQEGEVDMCLAIDGMRADWLAEGKAEGKTEGLMEATVTFAKNMLSKGKFTNEEVAEYSGLPLSKVKELAEEK